MHDNAVGADAVPSMAAIFGDAHATSAWPGLKEGKAFFFEKKNQKTFIRCRSPLRKGARQRLKVFCFFSSEKKTLLTFFLNYEIYH
jgi:hypothetical protein